MSTIHRSAYLVVLAIIVERMTLNASSMPRLERPVLSVGRADAFRVKSTEDIIVRNVTLNETPKACVL